MICGSFENTKADKLLFGVYKTVPKWAPNGQQTANGFIKPTLFGLLKGIKTGYFSGTVPCLGCVKNSQKSVELHFFEFQSN